MEVCAQFEAQCIEAPAVVGAGFGVWGLGLLLLGEGGGGGGAGKGWGWGGLCASRFRVFLV